MGELPTNGVEDRNTVTVTGLCGRESVWVDILISLTWEYEAWNVSYTFPCQMVAVRAFLPIDNGEEYLINICKKALLIEIEPVLWQRLREGGAADSDRVYAKGLWALKTIWFNSSAID